MYSVSTHIDVYTDMIDKKKTFRNKNKQAVVNHKIGSQGFVWKR